MRPCVVRPLRLAVLASALLPALHARAGAQLVTPRTVPVYQDAQFEIYPTSRPGLGGATIALDDTLADQFANPAKAVRLRGTLLLGAPYSHHIDGNQGGGHTLPLGLAYGGERWAANAFGAIQQLDRAGPSLWNATTSDRSANNQYVTAALAHRVGRGLSLGASGYRARLGAIDGVDLLYAGSDRIVQHGTVTDVRVGAMQEWSPGHTAELLVVRNRTDMTHEVHFTDFAFDRFTGRSTRTERNETNLDQTDIWGVHTEYVRPVGREGWRVGALATVNRLSHPKIPNYTLQNLPRDPGTTDALDLGVGIARLAGAVTFALDVVAEPMRSSTYAEAAIPLITADGRPIPIGGKTVENSFRFKNSRIRTGVGRDFAVGAQRANTLGVNAGLGVYSIIYDLRQHDNILASTRTQHEHWMEWTPQLGVRFRSRDLELSYAYQRSCGTDGCNFMPMGGGDVIALAAATPAAGGIIAAPSAPLRLRSGSETSHRLTVAIPVR